MRRKIIAGNWKMNKSHHEGIQLLTELFQHLHTERTAFKGAAKSNYGKQFPEIVVAPAYLLLPEGVILSYKHEVKIAAQNCASEKNGAFTGEVSAAMLKSIAVDYVIIGHSERRAYYGETDSIVAKKIDRVLENNMKAICCIGETLSEREAGNEFKVVKRQIEEGLFHLTALQMQQVIIAYEPVWAIGTGKTATPDQAQEMHKYIRSVISEKYGKELAENIILLYGGSCNPQNASSLLSQPDVDGGLIGGASLKVSDFISVIKAAL